MTAGIALKIYGERNTGTNYLESLCRQNLDAALLEGTVPRRYWRVALTRWLRRRFPGERAGWRHEAAREIYFDRHFDRGLGWKHMCPDPDRIGPERLASVRFAMLIKNPYSWVLSLYRRPYHGSGSWQGGPEALPAFLERPLPVFPRENLGTGPLRPIEVWNRKARSYRALEARAARACILRYEDFLADETDTLRRLQAVLEVPGTAEVLSVDASTKRDAMTRDDYAAYYLQERWRAKLDPAAVARINADLDTDLAAALGYARLDPAEATGGGGAADSGGAAPAP